jgi:ribosome biogenesis GTPase A
MMKRRGFGQIAKSVIYESDVVVEVVDARLLELTRNEDLERTVERAEKRLILCINKADLVPKAFLDKQKKLHENCVFVSCRERHGFSKLREMIYRVAAKSKLDDDKIMVGVVGYPNVGKSSVINMLKGRSSAGVSSRSGFTRSIQNIKITERIMLIDTPGVIPIAENDPIRLSLLASKNPDRLKDPDLFAMAIIGLFLKDEKIKALEKQFNIT